MLKMLFVGAVAIGILLAALQFMKQHHTSGTYPAGPVVVSVPVKNPLDGGRPSPGDKLYVP